MAPRLSNVDSIVAKNFGKVCHRSIFMIMQVPDM
jgi:hypothetical protein